MGRSVTRGKESSIHAAYLFAESAPEPRELPDDLRDLLVQTWLKICGRRSGSGNIVCIEEIHCERLVVMKGGGKKLCSIVPDDGGGGLVGRSAAVNRACYYELISPDQCGNQYLLT